MKIGRLFFICVVTMVGSNAFKVVAGYDVHDVYGKRGPKVAQRSSRGRHSQLSGRNMQGKMAGGRHMLRESSFAYKYLHMNAEEQKMVQDSVINFVKTHAQNPELVTKLKAELNTLVGNKPDARISGFLRGVERLQSEEDIKDFLNAKFRKIKGMMKSKPIIAASRYAQWADTVKKRGLQPKFQKQLYVIHERLGKLEQAAKVPVELGKKATDTLLKQEAMSSAAAPEVGSVSE